MYRAYSDEIKQTFGTKVIKLTLATPTTCPNRDGKVDKKGCHFCDRFGSKSFFPTRAHEISHQIEETIPALKKRFNAEKYISYLQTYTNTYGPIPFLREMYDRALDHPDIVGLDIATRPDCLEDDVIELLQEYQEKTHLTLELGVQSFREASAKWTNRAHTSECSMRAIEKIKKRLPKTKVVIHFILGLPGETHFDIYLNAYLANKLKIDGVKIHHLHVLKHTEFARLHCLDPLSLLDLEDYVEKVTYLLRLLHPMISIHRTHGVASRHEELLGPEWTKEKLRPTNVLRNFMAKNNVKQGDLYDKDLLIDEKVLLKAGYPILGIKN